MKSAFLRYRVFIFFTVGAFIFCLAAMTAINAVFDPLHIMRSPVAKDYYDSESRFAMPGLIRFNNAAQAIVGTSVIQDFDEAAFSRMTGQDTARYLLTGATAYEQVRLLQTLLGAENPPRLILWGLDPLSFTGALDSIRWAQFPEHLFQERIFLPSYLASFQTFYRFLRQLPDRMSHKALTPEQRFRTAPEGQRYGAERIYATYCDSGLRDRLSRLKEFDFSTQDEQIQTHLAGLISRFPQTEFIIFFPPYSQAQFAEYERGGVLEPVLDFREKAARTLAGAENARLIDFQGEKSLVSNPDHFRDSVHTGKAVMDHMARGFIGPDLDTPQDITRANGDLRDLAHGFSWQAVYEFCAAQSRPVLPAD